MYQFVVNLTPCHACILDDAGGNLLTTACEFQLIDVWKLYFRANLREMHDRRSNLSLKSLIGGSKTVSAENA